MFYLDEPLNTLAQLGGTRITYFVTKIKFTN